MSGRHRPFQSGGPAARDAQRRNELQDLDYRVYECIWEHLTRHPAWVIDTLHQRLGRGAVLSGSGKLVAPVELRPRQISKVQGELLAGAPVRPATEMSVGQVHEHLLAVRRDTAGRGHGGSGRSGAAGLDQRQGGR